MAVSTKLYGALQLLFMAAFIKKTVAEQLRTGGVVATTTPSVVMTARYMLAAAEVLRDPDPSGPGATMLKILPPGSTDTVQIAHLAKQYIASRGGTREGALLRDVLTTCYRAAPRSQMNRVLRDVSQSSAFRPLADAHTFFHHAVAAA